MRSVEAPQAASLADDRLRPLTEPDTGIGHPFETLKISVGEALNPYRRLVIVGAPGSGKTTLLRWLAVTFATGRQAERERLGSALFRVAFANSARPSPLHRSIPQAKRGARNLQPSGAGERVYCERCSFCRLTAVIDP